MLPVVGAAADVANGLWYAAEGNYADAALSFASAVPGAGDAIGAAKLGAKAATTAIGMASGAAKGGEAVLAGASGIAGGKKVAKASEAAPQPAPSGYEAYLALQKEKKVSTFSDIDKQITKGIAPKTVERVDKAADTSVPNEQPHIHFTDGTAMNFDGTPHDAQNGIHDITNKEAKWLDGIGWPTEIKE